MALRARDVAQVWAEVIGVRLCEVDTSASFFDLGGTSSMLMDLIRELDSALGVKTGLIALLEHPTIEEFVTYHNTRTGG